MKETVLDLTSICLSFPPQPTPNIDRSNTVLNALDQVFGDGEAVVVLEGAIGDGKTTAVAQYAIRHGNRAISVFLHPDDAGYFDMDAVRFDLASQITWILGGMLRDVKPEDTTTSYVRNRLLELRRHANYGREPYYIIIDGLDEVTGESNELRTLLDLLPLGSRNCKFLITGRQGQFADIMDRKQKCVPWRLPPFSSEEAKLLFDDIDGIDNDTVGYLNEQFHRIPARLASVRRCLLSGVPLTEIIERTGRGLGDLMEIEWRNVLANDSLQTRVLAVLAHSRSRFPLSITSPMLGVDTNAVIESVSALPFIVVDKERDEIRYEMEPFREFAAQKLLSEKRWVDETITSYLFSEASGDAALTHLPAHLADTSRHNDLIEFLSPEVVERMLDREQSIGPVLHRVGLGVDAAHNIKNYSVLTRFCLQRSLMSELGGAEVWRSEIEARMALRENDAALALAQSARMREDRLQLLAVVANGYLRQRVSCPQEILEQIQLEYASLNPSVLGTRALSIAEDLIVCCPELAIDLVEKESKASSGDNSLDWALTKLSIAACEANKSESGDTGDLLEVMAARISDPGLKEVSKAVSLLIGGRRASEVIRAVGAMEGTSVKLFLLRRWLIENAGEENAIDVAEHGLSLLIGETAYAPNARVYRDLASPLPYTTDESKLRKAIGRFDSQSSIVERLGPTQDYIRFQLTLARAEHRLDRSATRTRLTDIYLYASLLEDICVREECIAWLLHTLHEVDPSRGFEQGEKIHESTTKQLLHDLDLLLSSTADHFAVVRGIIDALAIHYPDITIDIISKLNTEYRRDQGYQHLATRMLRNVDDRIDIQAVLDVIHRIEDNETRGNTLVDILKRIASARNPISQTDTVVTTAINMAKGIPGLREQCQAYCFAYAHIVKTDKSPGENNRKSHVCSELEKSWESIDVGWLKLDTGFNIVKHLADVDEVLAKEFMIKTIQTREGMLLDAPASAWAYIACVKLSIRAFTALLRAGTCTQSDIQNLTDLIDRIPSIEERARLWAEVAIQYYYSEKPEECRKVACGHIDRMLLELHDSDPATCDETTAYVAPALFLSHSGTGLERIKNLPLHLRDLACQNISMVLFRKQPVDDPYEQKRGCCYDIDAQTIHDLCEVMEVAENDTLIYSIIEQIANSSLPRRGNLSYAQRAEASRKLRDIAHKKLPNSRFIQHDGYAIASDAQILRLLDHKAQDWLDIAVKARGIANTSDRAFVLSIIASIMPSKMHDHARRIMQEAKDIVMAIPATVDRVERLHALAESSMELDTTFSRECLSSAMRGALQSDDQSNHRLRRRIIDAAYLIDKDFASSIASLADSDPAHVRAQAEAKYQIGLLNLRGKVADKRGTKGTECPDDPEDYSQACWMLLGSLNAGRAHTVESECVAELLFKSHQMQLSEMYPILAWGIQNWGQRFAGVIQYSRSLLRPLFQATVDGARLAWLLAARASGRVQATINTAIELGGDGSIVIRAGDRDKAIGFLRDWLEQHKPGELIICDPNFPYHDLDLLTLIQNYVPDCDVTIITGRSAQEGTPDTWGERFRTHWRLQVSDQDPPSTRIVVVGTASKGTSPFHDRWWIAENEGLRMGTSYNGLGSRDSEISIIGADEVATRKQLLIDYSHCIPRSHNDERLEYVTIPL
jgi:hypothetical protein